MRGRLLPVVVQVPWVWHFQAADVGVRAYAGNVVIFCRPVHHAVHFTNLGHNFPAQSSLNQFTITSTAAQSVFHICHNCPPTCNLIPHLCRNCSPAKQCNPPPLPYIKSPCHPRLYQLQYCSQRHAIPFPISVSIVSPCNAIYQHCIKCTATQPC